MPASVDRKASMPPSGALTAALPMTHDRSPRTAQAGGRQAAERPHRNRIAEVAPDVKSHPIPRDKASTGPGYMRADGTLPFPWSGSNSRLRQASSDPAWKTPRSGPYRPKLLRCTRASIGAARWLDRSVLMISLICQPDRSSGQRRIEVCGPCGCRLLAGESAGGREEETVETNLLTSAASLTVAGDVRRRSVKPQQAGEGWVDGSGRSRPARWTAPGRPSGQINLRVPP